MVATGFTPVRSTMSDGKPNEKTPMTVFYTPRDVILLHISAFLSIVSFDTDQLALHLNESSNPSQLPQAQLKTNRFLFGAGALTDVGANGSKGCNETIRV